MHIGPMCASEKIRVKSQSYITTDSQSVSKSWCRAQSGTFDQRYFSFFFLKVSVLSYGDALSDERSGLSFVSLQSVYSSLGKDRSFVLLIISQHGPHRNVHFRVSVYRSLPSNGTKCHST
jgi:hypothetical protein